MIAALAALYAAWREAPQTVTASAAEEVRLESSFTADGVVKGATAKVTSRVMARISALKVKEGDTVSVGQEVATLSDESVSATIQAARAAVASAESASGQARAAMVAAQAKARSAVDTAQAQLLAASAKLRQAMAKSRPEEVEVARHKLEAAKSAHAEAMLAMERARKLLAEGAISVAACQQAETREALLRQELEAARDSYTLVVSEPRREVVDAAKLEVEVARKMLDQAIAGGQDVQVLREAHKVAQMQVLQARSNLNVAMASLDDLKLAAPIRGVVTKRHLEIGDMAMPGSPVVEIVDSSGAYIEGEMSDEDQAKARVGEKVQVTSSALPGKVFSATIVSIAASAELKPDVSIRTRIVRFRVRLDQPNALLVVGSEVDIEGKHIPDEAVLTIPSGALVFLNDQTGVWVVADGATRFVKVTTGRMTPERVEILSGLKPGDQVVTSNKAQLHEGKAVRVRLP